MNFMKLNVVGQTFSNVRPDVTPSYVPTLNKLTVSVVLIAGLQAIQPQVLVATIIDTTFSLKLSPLSPCLNQLIQIQLLVELHLAK